MNATDQAALQDLLEALGGAEEPIGMLYCDTVPEGSLMPKPGYLPTREEEASGQMDFGKLSRSSFSCVIRHIRDARREGQAAAISKKQFGCFGGAFFAGYQKKQLDMVARFVSTGTPGYREGELYLDSPETCHRVFEQIDPRPAPAEYCLFKPLTQFNGFDEPEVISFFARPEIISGLQGLAVFATGDIETVVSPWGAGCTAFLTWPVKYHLKGELKAVLGGWDPSARKYLKYEEVIFSVHRDLFRLMLDRWPDSFLKQHAWHTVKKRIRRSRKIWGE